MGAPWAARRTGSHGNWPGRGELRAIEIGFTWLAASAQGCGINAEAKLLLMSYAFGKLGVTRVDLKTDARNERSRRAIEALGATFEGVCGAGRCRGHRAKKGCPGTRRCTR